MKTKLIKTIKNLAHLTLRTVYSLGTARLNISDMCHLEPVTPPGNRLYLEDLNLWRRSRNCVCVLVRSRETLLITQGEQKNEGARETRLLVAFAGGVWLIKNNITWPTQSVSVRGFDSFLLVQMK